MPQQTTSRRAAMPDETTLRRGVDINHGNARDIVLPHDAAAESSVLSAMLTSDDVLRQCLVELKEEDFFLGRHRVIFRSIAALFDRNHPTDPISLVDHLTSEGLLERAGGASYVNELANNTFSLVAWSHHAELVRRDALLREMIVAAANISALAMDAPEDTKEVVDAAEKLLYQATNRDVSNSSVAMGDALQEIFLQIEEQARSDSEYLGIATGYKHLDQYLKGLRGGQLIVVGARPAVGKTSFALNLAVQAATPTAKAPGASVAFFSLEMSTNEIAQRMLSTSSMVDLSKIMLGKLGEPDWAQILEASRFLAKLDITIDDTPGTSVTEIRAKARRILNDKPRGLVVVDYLQLLEPANRRNIDSRATEVSEMSRGLKIMAKDLDIPVIALSQLNRNITGKPRRPQLSDLRESGSIEQDADVVILLDKSATSEEAKQSDRPKEGMTDFIIAKNRSGPTGLVTMGFREKDTRFAEIDFNHDEG